MKDRNEGLNERFLSLESNQIKEPSIPFEPNQIIHRNNRENEQQMSRGFKEILSPIKIKLMSRKIQDFQVLNLIIF